jgi:hypothetical protein
MRALALATVLTLAASTASAAVYRVPAVRMPAVFRVATAPVAPTLSIVVPTALVAPSLAAILAARGFNLSSMPRR